MPRTRTVAVLLAAAVALSALTAGGVAAALDGAGAGDAVADGGAQSPAQTQNQNQMGQVDDRRTIEVSGSARVQGEPDRAIVRLSVETRADDPSTARTQAAERADGMRAALSELGLDDDQVRSDGFRLHEDRRRSPDGDDDPTYVVRHNFEVTVEDLDRTGEVIDAALDGGATNVHGVQFTLSEEQAEQLRQEALAQAMDDARGEAETIADSGDLTVEGVRHASTHNNRRPVPVRETAAMAGGDAAGTEIEPGAVTVHASVQVRYDASA